MAVGGLPATRESDKMIRSKLTRCISVVAITTSVVSILKLCLVHAAEKSRYMGSEVTLTEAPNGAVINSEVSARCASDKALPFEERNGGLYEPQA